MISQNNPLVSIVVPVYNTSKYLQDCINSLLSQTYENIEILIVNDGSTDNSLEKINFYKQNKKIKIFSKKNGGLSSARNFGISKSSGKYICFVDSDDYVSNFYVERLLSCFENNDIDACVCNFLFVSGNNIKKNISIDKKIGNNLDFWEIYYNISSIYSTVTWNKMFLRRTLEDVLFIEGALHEDEFFINTYLTRKRKIVFINDYLYFYRYNPNSIMHSKSNKQKLSFFAMKFNLERTKLFLESNNTFSKKSFNDCIFGYIYSNRSQRKEYKKEINSLRKTIKCNEKKYRYFWSLSLKSIVAARLLVKIWKIIK